ncbi:glycoside hydrolase family 16 protein [Cercospora zeae-maydis SCOH1-5]|uniref:chitinase n=1 Tax=Cercospora zeae-maydis SCOH1-5 TaxID=717836 RepID=A0A6A6FLQ3_9PEZI|nr:glycoside hydrolase family 16 protein [Cercospora zeae-maydis SCOH1-5]
MSRRLGGLASIALLVASSLAQTFTDCNPNNSSCGPDPALGTTFSEEYNKTFNELDPRFWNVTAGKQLISFGDDGAELALNNEGESITVRSNFYIFWGQVEFLFQAAQGNGIISTVITLSDNLDEIDWEIKGGNHTSASNNYYGWGNLSQYNSEYPAMNPGPQDDFHNYTIDWTKDRIQLYLNGDMVRNIPAGVAGEYPQTPSRVQFGVWCGGCSDQPGTVEWAGGKPTWDEGPFVMKIKSLRITDGTTNATEYSYGDHSGTWESIKIVDGQSEAYKEMNKITTYEKAQKHWEGLSTGAKIGIACGVLGVVLIGAIAFAFYCIKQRKEGRSEALLQGKEWDANQADLMEYRTMMAKGNFAVSRQSVMMESLQEPKQSRLGRLSGRF